MYYFFDLTDYNGNTQRHIVSRIDGGVRSFPLTDDNPNTEAYLVWVAEGNTPEPWQPETTVADVPVEDVIEDGD